MRKTTVVACLLLGLCCLSFASANSQDFVKRQYSSDGVLIRETPVVNGEIDGIMKAYDYDGILAGKAFFDKGVLTKQMTYYKNGQVKEVLPYWHGLLHGRGYEYNEDGDLLVENYYSNGKKVKSVEYAPNSQKKKVKRFQDNRMFLEEEYEETELVGEKQYNAFGIVSEKQFKKNQLHGTSKAYAFGNLIVEVPYKNGKKDGVLKTYWENGNIKTETPYKDGQIMGVTKSYSENGELSARAHEYKY